MYLIFVISFFLPCISESGVSQVFSWTVHAFQPLTNDFLVVRSILSTIFAYFYSRTLALVVPKLLAVISSKSIRDINIHFCYYVTDLKYWWRFGRIKHEDVGVGIDYLIVFLY